MLADVKVDDVDRLFEADEITQVDLTFNDIYGKPVMTLRVEVPRKITVRGHRVVDLNDGRYTALTAPLRRSFLSQGRGSQFPASCDFAVHQSAQVA